MKHDQSNHRFASQIQPFGILQNKAQGQVGSQIIPIQHPQQRIPSTIQNALRFRASEKQKRSSQFDKQNQINPKTTDIPFTENENSKAGEENPKICKICLQPFPKYENQQDPIFLSPCQHRTCFCESCLHYYVIFKVKTFQEVNCPQQGCLALLDTNSTFFNNLPSDIQNHYNKIHLFYLTSQNSQLRLCPQQNCEGFLKEDNQKHMICSVCKISFCKNCLLKTHQGNCDDQELKFFLSNLHYRQCKRCNFVIEKNQGCNHMTCRCGYQFCYICGGEWTNGHICPGDREVPQLHDPHEGEGNELTFCGIFCRVLLFILKLPIKILFFLFLIPAITLNVIFQNIIMIFFMAIGSIASGVFCFSFELIAQAEGIWFFLTILFFPLTMMAGICLGFQRVFWVVLPQQIQNTWRLVAVVARTICCF